MLYFSMDMPAELHRRIEGLEAGTPGSYEVTVAKGPLVIMAHGLMSLDPSAREGCWITSAAGTLSPAEVEEALRRWSVPH